MTEERMAYRTCPLCEAGCGLEITVRADQIVRIRGDRDDVFSHGFICPKGSTLKQLHEDPDRLRGPLIKRHGVHVEVTWEEAWDEINRRLTPVLAADRNAVGVYVGNPNAHNLSSATMLGSLLRALGTRNRFSASTLDQAPKQVAAGWMFGTPVSVPVPDLDRTDYLLMLGANPYASNGSLCTAPDFPGRLEALRARGGRVVVVDPRRSRTAQSADEWLPIRPGTDALLLAALVTTLFVDGLADPGSHVAPLLNGWDDVAAALSPFTAGTVSDRVGIEASTITRIARELTAAPTAAVYGRIGTCTQRFGTTASWLVDVLNIATGNLDRPGGAMFSLPASGNATTRGAAGRGDGFRTGRGHSRVGGHPEVMGEYPAVALAEEIATPGPGQIRALVTVAGNPVLSSPGDLDALLGDLEFMVSVDIYLNETTRHADVILPPPSHLERSHYDVLLSNFAVRNVANWSAPVFERNPDQPDEWEILARLTELAQGRVPDPAAFGEQLVRGLLHAATNDGASPMAGRDIDELVALVTGDSAPDRLLDVMVRVGPFGDGFGARPGGLSLALLAAHPHGLDYGPLEPRLPEILRTASGRIEAAPEPLLADLRALADDLHRPIAPDQLLLVGRRDLRSNNSWMHNIGVLVSGSDRCTLQIHPDDANRLGVLDGALVRVTSASGSLDVAASVTADLRPGVVSLPHGWGHDLPGAALSVAAAHPGVNSNRLSPVTVDPLSGNAVLTAIEVRVEPVEVPVH